jgi:hypothetical protein
MHTKFYRGNLKGRNHLEEGKGESTEADLMGTERE